MKSSKILAIVVLVLVGWIFGFYLMKKKVNNAIGLNDDFFIRVANTYYNDSFSGVISKKLVDWEQHGYKKVVLVNQYETREVRFDYEWAELFKFLKIGDSVTKEKKTLDMRLRRRELDTMIRLNFSNIKDSWDYIDFLHELDSIYDR
ncbi:hypothetical protein LV716_13825 [Flagellimonas sp. HMM57]|uniref:hypothetical protein n=1 Tax=unclassified Flagellimonas TaxID=2644544 RepID=UPI0013D06378|nr:MULTISPECIES: hypothetical protein [unclassified Flagellimonas]UII75326.1 hypothetical protein LV716_13825 [Flagellimonas sp. HMM57]